ncbi:hypothetical protein AMATHDRAFT_144179 [Amanita thiersii Skay4041]|uniref:Tricalbin n=1 Tax=Amanita thiersii Skay4041 TaxID=703135 RepID=A0A2A9NSS9_9AGAR|nr:hypothetical protein AMATHDRAFT_144179 [Amanita thiersii Skay4041]
MSTNGSLTDPQAPPYNSILQKDANKNQVPVHSFDPDAPPEEKASAAGRSRDKLESVIPGSKTTTEAKGLTIDTGRSTVLPTITIEDADIASPKQVVNGTAEPQPEAEAGAEGVPGAVPSQAVQPIPDWYRVGWREMAGVDKPPSDEARQRGVLDMFISEQYYGYWYHNAGIILFAVITTHFLTRFRFGWGWLFIVLAVCCTYYTTSIARVRRRARDDIQRELVKTRLVSESESADWMNNFLDRFWLIYEPVLSQSIVASVDQILSANTPTFLDSLRLAQFTLGTKAPRIESVRTFPNTEDDIIIMDWAVSFTPNDISEMTPKEAAKKVNPKIELSVRVGKGLATAAMPILVEDITFSGRMRLQFKLMSNFPHVQIVNFCFLEKPVIDFVLKPIGGETFGFDIANVPGLSSFIHNTTHATLGPMMYDPNVFTLNLEQMLSGKPLDAAIGVVKVTLHAARGIKGTKIGGGTPDPYVSLSINNRAELARTKHKTNTYNPTWMETKFILVNNLNEDLVLSLFDYNDHRKDFLMGSTTFKLDQLLQDATQEGLSSPLLKDGKDRGELRYDLSYYPVLTPEENDGQLPETSKYNVGIVRLVLHQAKDLDNSKSLSGDLNPMAKVYLGDSKSSAFATQIFKHTNNPVWEAPYEFLCADKAKSVVTVRIIDDRDFLKDPVIGYMSIKLTDLLDSTGEAGRDWFPLSNCKSGKIRLSAEWKPLDMAGALQGADQYKPPIGVVRLHLEKAMDVKNVEATLGGKSDPYIRVLVNGIIKGRTEVVNNNLNPVWDQIIYIPVHSLRETLLMECMDYQHLTKDRHIGTVELHVSEIAKRSDDPRYPYDTTGVKTAADDIYIDRNVVKGTLHYAASFIPALNLKSTQFESRPNELQRITERTDVGDANSVEAGSSISSSPADEQFNPVPITIRAPNGHKKTGSSDTTVSSTSNQNDTTSQAGGGANATPMSAMTQIGEGIEMSTDDLLTQQSGIMIFRVLSGKLNKKSRLEVLLDDGYWPSFSTTRARSTHAQWDYFGEAFMKELDFGIVWLRLNEAEEGEKDDVIAEWKGDAKEFLRNTLAGPQTFTLHEPEDNNKRAAEVLIEARYVPVPVTLEPRESVNNQGTIRVTLLDGHEIRGVDRSGKSDPFAVFTLDGQKVFKSQTKKKTLHPEWNEEFMASVTSRVNADFSVEVFDWNQIEQAKSLGIGKIDLANIEPFEANEQVVALTTSKHGDKGQVRVRIVFQPQIIAKTRKNTSTFTSAGRAMTQLGGLPVSAGKGVLHGVAGGVSGIASVFRRGDRDAEAAPDLPVSQATQEAAVATTLEPGAVAFPGKTSMDGAPSSAPEYGSLRVLIVGAELTDDSKAYTVLRIGDKEAKTKHSGKTTHPEWNETFMFAAGPLTPKLYAWVHEHRTLGKDKELGAVEIELWATLQPQGHSTEEVVLPLSNGGNLQLRLEFDSTINPFSSGNSIASTDRAHRTISFTTPSRFSMRGRRPGQEQDD